MKWSEMLWHYAKLHKCRRWAGKWPALASRNVPTVQQRGEREEKTSCCAKKKSEHVFGSTEWTEKVS